MMRLAFAVLLAGVVAMPAGASPISGERQLIFEGARSGEGYFSADGTRMIFQSEREPGNPFFQIYTLDMETGDVTRLSPGVGKTTCGWLHPDGERALYASTQFDPEAAAKMQGEIDFRASGQQRRYSWDYDPTFDIVETKIGSEDYTVLAPALGYDAEGAYSPDGTKIVFASNRHAYAADLSEEDAAQLERKPSHFLDLYVMNADGSGVKRLTDTPGYDGGPFWSADGTKITWRRFSEDGARAEIYTMNADGTGEKRITELDVLSWAPFFHPSGEYLIFSTNLQGFANFELYLVDTAGTRQPVRVTDREGFDGLPTFTPDGRQISWTSNATSDRKSQIFIADWDHERALAMLAEAPLRRAAASPLDGTAPEIREADLRRHVEALTAEAMGGRMTGTEGERLATAYAAAALTALGADPAGDGGTMFQAFEFTAGVDLGEGNALTVSVDGEPETAAVGEAWTPLAFSSIGQAEPAGAVFVGYGIVAPEPGDGEAIDSYEGVSAEGKWVVAWRGTPADITPRRRIALARFSNPRYKASVAKARGAVGLILMPPPGDGTTDSLPRLNYEATGASAGLPVIAVNRATAARMLSILGDERAAMTETIEAGGSAPRDLIGVEVSANLALDFAEESGRNVVARLDLDGKPAEDGLPPLVIGAHIDHLGVGPNPSSLATGADMGKMHPGADDNASGVAALIEIAQKLAADRDDGKLKGTRDVIVAAWSGEELGLLGASHWVDATIEASDAEDLSGAVSAYLNMDMVGRMEDRVILYGLASSPVWAREIERRNAVIGLPIVTSDDTYLPTDATEFYLAGVPILSAFTGAHEDYHKPSDTPEKLNYEGLRDIARFMALVARSRVMEAEEPDYIEVARPTGDSGRRMSSVFLGTIPDYAIEGQAGVPLSGVVKGGPAEEAGVRGGDVLVGLAGQELENIYDFVRTLNGLKAGEAVDITVLRDGGRETFDVTPRPRE